MPDALTSYFLFLAEGVTVVALLATLGVALVTLGRPRKPRSRLRVKNVSEHYDHLHDRLAEAVLPKAARKERRRARRRPTGERPRVFVLDFHGDLRASRVKGLREEITAVLGLATPDDEVVVRLTNPGGAVSDQGLAASQLQRVRHRGVPLTVCVDTVAASGGYMMACVAGRIVAAPFAVVGSIGVVSSVPNFHRLLDRLGIDVEQFTGGQYKRTVTMFGRNTDADRAKVTEQVNEIHDLFKDFVHEQRPGIDLERVATGEYWYGTDALELNLVDELSTSDDYLLRARERADLFEVSYTVPRSRVRQLTEAGQAAVARLR
ncbi:protease SohB [Kineosporia succinea]|uniref:Serine protease SohB n=1 Tax=Kineosporia succinea TaxID=84632 RepID=A0ABT9P1R1_9ACTN|nr:protease SohB [Kineosporia succinea]MDP9826025.1 serine protease SohB [Kineosporia succinea]